MRKNILFVLGTIIALSTAACGNKITEKDTEVLNEDSVQIPNPFVNCVTLEKAEQLAGFEISIPEKMPEAYSENTILAVENDLIEINYINGDSEIIIRKAKGNEDISGDYNEYKENNTINFEDVTVTVKGNNGKVNVAAWTLGDFAYSININSDGEGLDSSIVNDMIKSIK